MARTRKPEGVYPCYAHANGEQLFEMVHDPDEHKNRGAEPSSAALRQSLRDALLEAIILQDYPKHAGACSLWAFTEGKHHAAHVFAAIITLSKAES